MRVGGGRSKSVGRASARADGSNGRCLTGAGELRRQVDCWRGKSERGTPVGRAGVSVSERSAGTRIGLAGADYGEAQKGSAEAEPA